VEGGVVVVGGCAEGEEVLWTWGVGQGILRLGGVQDAGEASHLGGFWDALAEDFDFEVPAGRVECDRHDGGGLHLGGLVVVFVVSFGSQGDGKIWQGFGKPLTSLLVGGKSFLGF
jgi:hypothetical protein